MRKLIYIVIFSLSLYNVSAKEYILSDADIYNHDLFRETIENYIQDPKDPKVSNLLVNHIKSIPYESILDFSTEIHILSELFIKDSIIDDHLKLNFLKIYALYLYKNKEYKNAIPQFEAYFEFYNSISEEEGNYAFEYSKYSYCYYRLKEYEKFVQLSKKGIKKSKYPRSKNIDACYFLINLGNYYNRFRVLDSSRYYANRALSTYQESKQTNYKILSDIYKLKANVESYSENHELAKVFLDKSIENLLLTSHTELELASLYNSKGLAYMLSNQLENAIKYFKIVIQIYEQELPRSRSLANKYYNLGMAYSLLEDHNNALIYFNKSLDIEPDISNYFTHRFVANTYFSLDSIQLAREKYEKVIDYLFNYEKKNTFQLAFTKLSLGQLLVEKTNEKKLGEKVLTESINGFYNHFKKADINLIQPLNILGTYLINNGEIDKGLDTLQKALFIASQNFSYNSNYENPEYNDLFNSNFTDNTIAWKAKGFYLRYIEKGLLKDLIASQETYSLYIHCASENRKFFDNTSSIITSSQVHYVYNEAINVTYLLYELTQEEKYLEDIFSFIEGKKSFTLFQSLKILEQKKLLNIPKDLLDNEDEVKYQISILSEEIIAEESGENRKIKLNSLRKKEFLYRQKLDSIQDIFRKKYSGFYELKYGFKELSIQEIKEKIKTNTAFVNYSISDSLLHILTFTHDTISLQTQTIDSSFFSNINTMVELLKAVDTDNSYAEFQRFSKSSHYLFQKLVYPIKDIIHNCQIIFIPDDELSYISYDALVEKLPDIDRPDYRSLNYLINNYKTNVANSMQIYFNMKERLRNPNNEVYAFAPHYPMFPNNDSLPSEYQNLRPLEYAEIEVKNIEKSISTVAYVGKEATKDSFRQNAKNAGILHLAMHTIIDDKKPLQSKFLFTHNDTKNSSTLNTYELLALDLNAELAVLSGCSTGDGKLQKGEGVMSLSSGFQYAGVPAIVMSLWEVNDRFGSLVIHKFYENLSSGSDKKEALYNAKKDVLNQGNALYSHPYYWAGLTLMGDESNIKFIKRYQWDKIVIVFSPILFLLVVLFQTRKKWLIKRA